MYKAMAMIVLAVLVAGCGGDAAKGPEGSQVLTINDAARAGDLEKVKSFVESNKFDQTERDAKSNMTIHYAAQGGNPEVIRLLVQHGADVNAPSGEHMTPLQIAEKAGKKEAVDVLKELGATN